MFGLGMSELIFIGVLALIVIGPKELPELARTLGRFINDLKRSTSSLTEDFKDQAGLGELDLFDKNKSSRKNRKQMDEQHNPEFDNSPTPLGDQGEAQNSSDPDDETQLELVEQTTSEDKKTT